LAKRTETLLAKVGQHLEESSFQPSNRLVYKKDSMKTLSSNSIKNEMSIGVIQTTSSAKLENKENDFSQANVKFNKTNSSRDQKNIKSMSGIKKLYTLKANSSNRRMESQSYRDLSFKSKNIENIKNGKSNQNCSNISTAGLGGKRKHLKNKISTSETPKLRSQNEGLFTAAKANSLHHDVAEEESKTSIDDNFSSNYNTRLIKKPPNYSSSGKQSKPSNTIK